MLNIKKFLLAIGLIPKPTSEIDSQGELEVLNTDGKLRYHNGTSVSPVVTESHSATLSNKELTSPVINTSVSGTAIDTDGTLAANSDTKLASQKAVKTYVDSNLALQNEADEITVDPAVNGNTNVQSVLEDHETRIDSVENDVSNLVTLTGVPVDSTTLGTFTGTTIPDNQTVKQSLQALETAHEEVDQNVNDLISLSGVAENSTTLGTFTGTTIPDNQNVKEALQALETSVETKASSTDLSTHTGASTNVHGLAVGSSVVGTTDSQALTNKTLTGAVINGSTKISAFLLEESQDNSQSGSLVTLTSITKPIVRLTNASLVSVTGITASEITGHGGVVTLINTTANEIAVLNNAGTASEAILTGTDDDIDLAPNGCLLLKYDTVSDKWRVIGGTGSGSVVIKALAGENLNARETVYLSIGASDSGRTSGRAYKLDASNDNRIEFVGFVKETVTSGSTAKIVTSGILKGFTGLSVGQPVYLNPNTPGVYTQTDPSDSSYNARWVIKLGTAISSTQVLINPDLASSAYFNPEIVSNFSIANNQSSVANITSLIIDGASYRGFIIEYTLYRKTDTNETAQVGRLRGVYKTVANTWLMSDDYSGENAGVTFSITSSGQLQYTSTNISGTNYSGVFDYKVTDLFEVI